MAVNNSDTCRLCLRTDDILLYSVDTKISWRKQDHPLYVRIIECVGTNISPDDGLPQKVCHQCLYMIDTYYHFRETCEANETFLKASQNSATANESQVSEDDSLHESITIYDNDSIIDEKLFTSPAHSDIDIAETTTLTKEWGEINLKKDTTAIPINKNDKEISDKLTNKNVQSSLNKKVTCTSVFNADGNNSSEMIIQENENIITNNKLEAKVSSVDKDGAVLPIERNDVVEKNKKSITINKLKAKVSAIDKDVILSMENNDVRYSSDIVIEKEKLIINKKCEMIDSVSDADVSVLATKRMEQSSSNEDISNYKGNKEKQENDIKRHGIKRSRSKEVTHVSSNEQTSVKRSERIRLRKEVGHNKSFSAGGVNLKQSKISQLRTMDNKIATLLDEESVDSPYVKKMKSILSSLINDCDTVASSSNSKNSKIKTDSLLSQQVVDIENIIKEQREQFKVKENADKKLSEKEMTSRQCNICDRILNSCEYKSHMESHKIAEKEDKKYTCVECPKSFSVKFSLKRHMLSHNPVKPFHCSKCKRSYTDRSNLLKHERGHNSDKPFGCPFCHKAYADNSDLVKHFEKHHKSVPDDTNIQAAIAIPVVDHECYTKRVKLHPRLNHASRNEIIKNGSDEDDTDDDDLDYFKVLALDNEDGIIELDAPIEGDENEVNVIDMPLDDMDFWCRICLICFPTLQDLEAHAKSHKKDKVTCDKEFDITDNLKEHCKLHFLLGNSEEN